MTANTAPAAPEPDHGRTPDNTPIPGGGRWAWDAAAGAWIDRDATPTDTPSQE